MLHPPYETVIPNVNFLSKISKNEHYQKFFQRNFGALKQLSPNTRSKLNTHKQNSENFMSSF